MIQIEKRIIQRTDNHPNQSFTDNIADYITIHETANTAPTATAESHASWLFRDDGTGAPYSWHYSVDQDSIFQSLEDHQAGWHAGDGSGPGNTRSIGIELCICDGHDFEKTKDRAAALVAHLENKGHGKLGVVPHQHWSGKNCPTRILESGTWDDFIKRVAKARKAEAKSEAAPPVIERPPAPRPAPPPQLPPTPNLSPPRAQAQNTPAPQPSLIQGTRTLKKGSVEVATTGSTGGFMAILSGLGVNIDMEIVLAGMIAVPPLRLAGRRLLRYLISTIRELRSAFTFND